MSINLYCKEMDLVQTPTYITYMCYSNGDGGWEGIRYRYAQYIRSEAQRAFNAAYGNRKEQEAIAARREDHLKELYSHDKLTFDIM